MSIKCTIMWLNDKPVTVYDNHRKHPMMKPHVMFSDPNKEYRVRCLTDVDFIPIELTSEDVEGIDVETYKKDMFNVLATPLAQTYAMPLTWDDITFFKNDDGLIVVRIQNIDSKTDAFFPISDKGVLINNGMNRSIKERLK